MLALRIDQLTALVLEDPVSKEPIGQIFISERSPVKYVDLIVDAPKDKLLVHRKKVERKIEKL